MTNSNAPRVRIEPTHDRAQPGDVLGIEEDGKTTELGDTHEDEVEKKHDADEEVVDEVRDRNKDRAAR